MAAPDEEPRTDQATGISPGEELVNPALHLRAVVLDSNPEILRAETEAGSGGNGGPLHRHLRQEERFVGREGTIKVRRGLRGSQLVGPGETFAIPARTPHTFKVEGAGARFVTEFRPPTGSASSSRSSLRSRRRDGSTGEGIHAPRTSLC